MPHVPLFVSDKFKGKSAQGLYGDVIQEIDWSVGEVLATLKKHGLEENTLVIFTSDNGPWLSYGNHAGTKGSLREGKGSVWEGGVRVPCVAKWPGKIPAGSVQTEPLMTIDVFPTLAKLIGAELPKLKIDGKDAWPLFACEKGAKCPQEAYWHYYGTNELQAVRSGKWKLILPHTCRMIEDRKPGADGKPAGYKQVKLDKPMLFDLEADVGELKDVAAANPEVLAMMQKHADTARAELGDSLTKAVGKGVREPGRVAEGK
jgi:arylsulfatase